MYNLDNDAQVEEAEVLFERVVVLRSLVVGLLLSGHDCLDGEWRSIGGIYRHLVVNPRLLN